MSPDPPDESPWLIDFFEEGETHENVSQEPPPAAASRGRRLPRPTRQGPSIQGRARAGWLGLGVAALLLIVVVVAVAVSGGGTSGADSAYLVKLAAPAQDSEGVGSALTRLLGVAPSTSTLESGLHGLLSRQRRDLNETNAIVPPPRLRAEQQQAVSAMQFRVGALAGLLRGFRDADAHPTGVDWAAQLSIQADRLIASDVIWSDFFVAPTNAQLVTDGDRSARAPGSRFVADANITAPEAMASVLVRLQGHATTTSGAGTGTTTSPSQTSVLKLGDKGKAVTAWQRQLNTWIARQTGLTKLKLTGTFDQATQTATMELQTAAKITSDGVVGPMTRAALAAALGHTG